jgi:hypothetical protein
MLTKSETQRYCCVIMIPPFEDTGLLPPGVHAATWNEFIKRFGFTPHRRRLLAGLKTAIKELRKAGCQRIYVDGSFVTSKEIPGDFDACWDWAGVNVYQLSIDSPTLLDFSNSRAAQKARYGGELFPLHYPVSEGQIFLDFFQIDKNTGNPKGIIVIDLRNWRS